MSSTNTMKTPPLLVHLLALIVLTSPVVALELSWPLTQIVQAETPDGGVVEAIQSKPPGHPLFLGRPGPHGVERNLQPSLQDGTLVFGPNTTAFVADFWKNFKDFGFEIELMFDSVDVDQTILRVSGSWELRLAVNDGDPTLQLIGFRKLQRAVHASLIAIEVGKTYTLKGGIGPDGLITLESSDGESSSASLGQPPEDWEGFPEFYVGSSNPRHVPRPFHGTVSRLQFHAEEEL